MKVFQHFCKELKILLKFPKMFYYKYFYFIIPNYILWIDKDIRININWYKFLVPNNWWVLWVLLETFVRKLFSEMKWLKKVLDIWWFIWESAIFLSTYNDEIYTYELSPTNFKYLSKNCEQIKNIHYYNWCVSNSNEDFIKFSETWNVSPINKREQEMWYEVKIKNYNIIGILKDNNFDWLKIDIEWWEYDILNSIVDAKLFKFKKWFIEFHDLDKKENMEYFNSFYKTLEELWYTMKLYNNEKENIKINSNLNFCNLYFEK